MTTRFAFNTGATIIIKVLLLLLTVFSCIHRCICQTKEQDKPRFGEFQCRADAQKWTVIELTDQQRKLNVASLGVLVNGQMRMLPLTSFGVSTQELEQRASEMATCQLKDLNFQRQFNTYALIERQYSEEVLSRYRYFLLNHHLLEQFAKEDAQSFK